MSKEIIVIENTGRDMSDDLHLSSFFGNEKVGVMLQINQPNNGFIELSITDCYKLTIEIALFIKNRAHLCAIELQKEIDKNEKLKKTIFQEAVECEHFINDLKIIEMPLRLLS